MFIENNCNQGRQPQRGGMGLPYVTRSKICEYVLAIGMPLRWSLEFLSSAVSIHISLRWSYGKTPLTTDH